MPLFGHGHTHGSVPRPAPTPQRGQKRQFPSVRGRFRRWVTPGSPRPAASVSLRPEQRRAPIFAAVEAVSGPCRDTGASRGGSPAGPRGARLPPPRCAPGPRPSGMSAWTRRWRWRCISPWSGSRAGTRRVSGPGGRLGVLGGRWQRVRVGNLPLWPARALGSSAQGATGEGGPAGTDEMG